MDAKDVAEIGKLHRLAVEATSEAGNHIAHHQFEGMELAFHLLLLMASDADAFAVEKDRLFWRALDARKARTASKGGGK